MAHSARGSFIEHILKSQNTFVFLALEWHVVWSMPGTAQHLVSTSPAVCSLLNHIVWCYWYLNRRVTVPQATCWGDSSVGCLIKGMVEVRTTAVWRRASNNGFYRAVFFREINAFGTYSYMHPLLKYPISDRTSPSGLGQNCPGRGGSPVQGLAKTHVSLLPPSASCKDAASGVVHFRLDVGVEEKGSPRPWRPGLARHLYTPLQVKPRNVFASDSVQSGGNILPIIYSHNKPLPQAHFYAAYLIRYFVTRGRGGRKQSRLLRRWFLLVPDAEAITIHFLHNQGL